MVGDLLRIASVAEMNTQQLHNKTTFIPQPVFTSATEVKLNEA